LRALGIPDRTTAEFHFQTEEQTHRRILDCVRACVFVGAPTGELLYVNKVGVAALGRPIEEITGERWMDYIHPDDVDVARTQWKACIAAREPADIVVRLRQHDGVYRWQSLLAEPLLDDNRNVVNWYLIATEIDETVKAQQALAASEKEARELLDRLPGRFVTHTGHDLDFVSRLLLEETGTTLEGLQNLGFLNFVHPDDRGRIKEGYLRSVQERSAHDTIYRWAERNGDYRWRHSRSVPYFNEDGSVYKWYGAAIDIDDLYRSMDVIREREAQLNWLTETVPSLLWRADAQGRIEYVNKRAETYTGWRLDELRANGWYDLVHPDDSTSTIEAWQDSLSSGRPYDGVYRLRAADGSYRWFQCKATAMRDTEGEIVNWYGLATDIHERQLAQEALRNEELNLRNLVDAIPAMIWSATPGGNIDRWNHRTLALIGKSWEELDGQGFLSLVPEEDRDRVHSRWIQAVHEGTSYQDTYQITGADGKVNWYLVRGEPFRDDSGEILHWYCVCTDISDLKQTEAALQQREHQLRREIAEHIESKRKLRNYQDELIRTENLAVIGKMSAGLAHEISQPIAAMATLSENAVRFLQRGDRSTAEFNLSRIDDLVTRLSTLTGRLRSFARRPDGENTAVPVVASIESAVTLLSHRLKKEQVDLRVVAPSQPLLALCEAVRLEQVLVNLVSNAIEAMETSETRAVEIRSYREGDRVVTEILDTGIGLTDTVQAKLFEPFFTTKKASGLGLGLAICSDIVASFGGSLTARNRPEGGALFRLMLRSAPEEETCK